MYLSDVMLFVNYFLIREVLWPRVRGRKIEEEGEAASLPRTRKWFGMTSPELEPVARSFAPKIVMIATASEANSGKITYEIDCGGRHSPEETEEAEEKKSAEAEIGAKVAGALLNNLSLRQSSPGASGTSSDQFSADAHTTFL